MRSHTTSPPLTVTLLAALWVSVGRCGSAGSPWPGCDSGKLSLERDLPRDAVWDCPVSFWPEPTQILACIDTVYDPEPARQVCLDKPISYNRPIPNSGVYRPVRAEHGEYLYCPPQRWLNNLHHGATVLLYHPCAPLRERLLLSVLARSCLTDYIVTVHPELSQRTPVALVSWGRTLEMSTAATSDVCNWLEMTTTAGSKRGDVGQTTKYNLLLTRPAEQHQHTHPEKHSPRTKSVRRCCEQTLISLRDGGMDSVRKKRSTKATEEERKRKQSRAASRETQGNVEHERETENTTTNGTVSSSTEEVQKSNETSGPGTRASSLRTVPPSPQPKMLNQEPTPRLLTTSGLNAPEPLGSRTSEPKPDSQPQPVPLQPSPEHPDLSHRDPAPGTEILAHRASTEHTPETPHSDVGQATHAKESTELAKQRDKDSAKHNQTEEQDKRTEKDSDEGNLTDGKMKDKQLVDVKEREVEHRQTHGNTHTHSKSKKTWLNAAQSQPDPPSQPHHRDPQPENHPSDAHDCGHCDPEGHCDCTEPSGAQGRAAERAKGTLRTPRTDEAVWAAAALGFLLVLLALSVLHTRLYRHWRTTPSLYWHDPRQDYDSVADVIRRRLRIAKRRRKRSRRQECVLLPSSSSSDEDQ